MSISETADGHAGVATSGEPAGGEPAGLPTGFIERVGTALVAPRCALAAADDADASGKTGSDVTLLVAMVFVATRARELVAALWVGIVEDAGIGMRAVISSLSRSIAMDLAFLFIAAIALTLAAGRKRAVGRDFDLACVAFVPLIAVELLATLALQLGQQGPTPLIRDAVAVVAYGWSVAVLVLAWRQARSRPDSQSGSRRGNSGPDAGSAS